MDLSLTKIKSDGSTTKGSFAFDMSEYAQTLDDAKAVWGKGNLQPRMLLCFVVNHPMKVRPGYSYDILKLDDQKMVLSLS
jgi:hypothetical protein